MADGPRCKRRKQANPKRSSVTEFNNGLEASSDSDDEDKLHIVEEDSLQEPEVAAADGTTPKDSHDDAKTVLPFNGSWNGVKEECVSEEEEGEGVEGEEEGEEEEVVKDALVEEILQQGDTAVIYPEAPEDEQSPAETGGADENGTPDSFSQLHTCPYCSRGYKRNASLKEHIKYRHETSEDNYSCSHCSYTFTYRSQLERHMSHHRGTREQVSQTTGGTGGTRKFKCTECSKAFKYKHHLKEHLRIHSGEKPYECSNCKKRFSHSGSYSSHISSKKCVSAAPTNGVTRTSIKIKSPPTTATTPVMIAPARVILKEKTESKPLQEQLPVTQIKSEPVEYECKPATAAPATSTGANGVVNGGTATPAAVQAATLPQGVAMVVPTVGLMSPISINLNDLQNVLKVAMDGNVLRQVMGTANRVVTQGKQGIVVQQPQQQIISLPAFVDHDGTTKIIINYSISPAAATTATTHPAPFIVKNNPLPAPTVTSAAAPTPTKTDRPQTPEVADLTIVKAEPEPEPVTVMETEASTQTEKGTVKTSKTSHTEKAQMPKPNSSSTCLLCDDCPDNLEALHLLQHRKAANGEAVDSAALDPSFAALLSEAGVTLEEPPVEDLVSLLKTYFASNANPSQEELRKISESVSIPVEVVRKWFVKMNSGKNAGKYRKEAAVSKKTEITNSNSEDASNQNGETMQDTKLEESAKVSTESGSASPSSPLSLNTGDLVIVKSEPEDPEALDSQAEPLDLSLPKHLAALATTRTTPPLKQQEHPLNLTCLRKEQLEGQTIFVNTPQTGRPVNIVTAAQLPTLVAIAGQGTVGCLSAINTTTKRTILIPQLTYTYATTAGSTTEAKTVVLNGHKPEKRPDSSSDGNSTVEEQHELAIIKKRRLENGVYPCDLCSKVFQKGSSLLRHKYEHTGKRPHECNICKKAFKHKHHLIEHSRLHSGEKPYQCDKCGKRFSHSGSYSQHMNHRYSYCKKDGMSAGSGSGPGLFQSELSSPGAGPQSDSRTTTPPSQLDSDERESEEEEDDDDEAMCMDDIRVVQVDDGECEIYEGNFEEFAGEEEVVVENEPTGEGEEEEEEAAEGEKADEEEEEVVSEVVKVKLVDDQREDEEEMEEITEEMEEITEDMEEITEDMEEITEEKEEITDEKEEITEEKEEITEEKEEITEEKEEITEEMEEITEEKEEITEEKEEITEEKEEITEEKEEITEEKEEITEEKEEITEEKEDAASEETEETADCEADTDKSIREGADGGGGDPTEEAVTDAK